MGESSDVVTRKARKNHQCDWCGKRIFKGDTFRAWTWFDDGATAMHSHKVCYNTAMNTRVYYDDWGNERMSNEPVWFDRDAEFG